MRVLRALLKLAHVPRKLNANLKNQLTESATLYLGKYGHTLQAGEQIRVLAIIPGAWGKNCLSIKCHPKLDLGSSTRVVVGQALPDKAPIRGL